MFNQKGCLKNKCLDAVVYLLNGAEFLQNWFPTLYLHLNDLTSLQTQSVKNAVIFFFFLLQGPASFPGFCVSVNGISSFFPVTQPRNPESSFVCSTFHLCVCNSFNTCFLLSISTANTFLWDHLMTIKIKV